MPVSFACWDWLVLYSAGAWKGLESPGWTGTLMHGFSEQNPLYHSSCAVVLPAQHESSCAALHGPLNSILPGAKVDLSKPCAYAAIYLFRPLCRSMFRFMLVGWSPQARSMYAVGRGVLGREGLVVTGRGELSVLKTCLLCFQRVLFTKLRERHGFKISLTALWAIFINRIWLLRPGRSSSNFTFRAENNKGPASHSTVLLLKAYLFCIYLNRVMSDYFYRLV